MNVPRMSLISSGALELFKCAAVIIEQHLVRLKERPLSVQDNYMLRKEIDYLPEFPICLLKRRLRAVTLDGNSSNPAGVID